MKKSNFLSLLSIVFLLLFACGQKAEKREEQLFDHSELTDEGIHEERTVSFHLMDMENTFPEAVVEMFQPLGNQNFKPGKIPFEFNIKNYPLREGPGPFQLMMSVNGANPIGFQSPIFQLDLNQGAYRVVAFLVDESGLALKDYGNYVDRDFTVGDSGTFPYSSEPYLSINMPYDGQRYSQDEEVLVDFLVLGGDLLLDQLKVQVSVGDLVYETNEMTTVAIANLPEGEHKVRVKLLRTDGKDLEGPFSSAGRDILVR